MDGLRFDFWDALLLCGVIQGLIVAVLIIIRKRKCLDASLFLSATLLIFSLHNVLIVCRDTNLSEVYPIVENLPINLILGFGPCIYFYIFFSFHPRYPKLFLLFHFIPLTIQLCYYLLSTIKGDLHLDYSGWKLISQTEQVSALISVCVYTFLSLKMLSLYSQKNLQSVIKLKPVMLIWLKRLLRTYMVLWLVWLSYTILDIFYFNYSLSLRDYFPLYLLVAALTYWIGIMAYMHPIIPQPDSGNKSFGTLNETEIQQNLRLLQDIMVKEKLFINPDLNLKQVAANTGISVNLISFIINKRLNQSFNDWINGLRVSEVKKQITSSRLKEVTLVSIAFECGFNSKATFNRVFKQQTGLTPREYLFQASANK